jgi:hypothetical protein
VASEQQPVDQPVTRALCALLYLNVGICDAVWLNLMAHPERAWGLCPQVDLLALLRHARAARRILLVRDMVMLALLTGVPALLVVRLAERQGTFTVMLLGCLLLTAGVPTVKDDQPVKDRRRLRWARIVLLAIDVALALMILTSDVAFVLTATVAGVLLVWLVSLFAHYLTIMGARRVWWDATPPADLAPALSGPLEKRLERVAETNIVIYHEDRAPLPFVGSGVRLDPWDTIPIDTGRGALAEDGSRSEPKPVDVGELYRFLDAEFPVDSSEGEFRTGFRLYADGSWLDRGSRLIPSRLGPPLMRLSPDEIVRLAEGSAHEERQRTHFFVESTGYDGALVVTLFVNLRMKERILFVGLSLNGLFPLRKEVTGLARRQPPHAADAAGDVLKAGSREAVSLLMGSPRRLAKRLRWARVLGRLRLAARLAAHLGRLQDFGASITPREGLAIQDPDQLDYNVRTDLEQATSYMQGWLVVVLRQFLAEHGIDTTDFDPTGAVVKNIQNFHVNTISGAMVGLGNSNTFAGIEPPTTPPATEQKGS